MKSHDLSRRVAEFLERNPRRSFKTKELARALHLPKQGEQYQALKAVLRALLEEGRVVRAEGRAWMVRADEGTAPAESDAPREVVGTVRLHRNRYIVQPDGKRQQGEVLVAKRDLGGAVEGDKVVVTLTDDSRFEPEGIVSEVLGRRGQPRTEMTALARRFGLTLHFPASVESETRAIPDTIPDEEIARRLDLRDRVVFTIDPEDAKDFDDAVSIETDGQGNTVLGVHIADVSHYVTQDSALDHEALKRGTSVYLVDGVIPMLPERLSNQLCSLQQDRDRLAYSVFMTLTPKGVVTAQEIHKTVIRSRRRFTYEDAQRVIDTGKGDCAVELAQLDALTRMLTRKRLREGSIDFNMPEVKFVFGPGGEVLDIVAKPRLQSMRLIEECMLLANRTVAGALRSMGVRGSQLPFLYRVHDLPDPEKVRELVEFIRHLGLEVKLDSTSSKSFQRMIEAVAGKDEEAVVQDVTIRSMAKAVYSEKNIGHFGLGFALYTHFTSPIRRYPDLIVHRLLHEYQSGAAEQARRGYEKRIADIARHSSERERLAVEAERESVKIKQVEYMRRHVGDSFDAIVSGVTSYGLYVEIISTLVEGLVHIRAMDDDYYEFDARKKSLIGRRRGRRYRLGDHVRVQVVRVDPVDRQIDFILEEEKK